MPSFKLTIAYDGTAYHGWQLQVSGRPTIQGQLERALVKFTKRRIAITGASRTDGGVHALGQVASLTIPDWRAGGMALLRAINSRLPDDIVVLECQEVRDEFHAINACRSKRYRYQLQCGGQRHPFGYRYHWSLSHALDVAAMRSAAQQIVGQQDFACFQAAGGRRQSTVRHVRDLVIEQLREPPGQGGSPSGMAGLPIDRAERTTEPDRVEPAQWLTIEVEADGFLYNMVRNIVGTLVMIGRGERDADWLAEVLESRDRTRAGQTAPPNGLFLLRVNYGPGWLIDQAATDTETSRPMAAEAAGRFDVAAAPPT
jgi:tRNA pseudouridine38-40 synthase